MAQAKIAKLPLRVLQNYLEKPYSTVESRIWWSLSAKIDDALGEYGGAYLAAITASQEQMEPIKQDIAGDPEPDLALKDKDPDAFELAMNEWKERNTRRQNAQLRVQIKLDTAVKALDDINGKEIVDLELNATQETFAKRKWENLKDLPGDRLSNKIHAQIDQFFTDLKDSKSNGKKDRRDVIRSVAGQVAEAIGEPDATLIVSGKGKN